MNPPTELTPGHLLLVVFSSSAWYLKQAKEVLREAEGFFPGVDAADDEDEWQMTEDPIDAPTAGRSRLTGKYAFAEDLHDSITTMLLHRGSAGDRPTPKDYRSARQGLERQSRRQKSLSTLKEFFGTAHAALCVLSRALAYVGSWSPSAAALEGVSALPRQGSGVEQTTEVQGSAFIARFNEEGLDLLQRYSHDAITGCERVAALLGFEDWAWPAAEPPLPGDSSTATSTKGELWAIGLSGRRLKENVTLRALEQQVLEYMSLAGWNDTEEGEQGKKSNGHLFEEEDDGGISEEAQPMNAVPSKPQRLAPMYGAPSGSLESRSSRMTPRTLEAVSPPLPMSPGPGAYPTSGLARFSARSSVNAGGTQHSSPFQSPTPAASPSPRGGDAQGSLFGKRVYLRSGKFGIVRFVGPTQ